MYNSRLIWCIIPREFLVLAFGLADDWWLAQEVRHGFEMVNEEYHDILNYLAMSGS